MTMAVKQIARSQGRELKANPGFVLRRDAAIAWDNAVAAFGKDVLLTGAWRSYETQERLFRERYDAWAYSPYGDYRYWKGVRYGRVRGAAAAVPGTSNHGGGVAVDVKTRRSDGDPGHAKAVVFWSWDDKDRQRFLQVAKQFGWDDDEGRRVGELWHLTYYPSRDRYRGKIVDPKSGKTRKPKNSNKKRKPHRIATIRRGDEGWRVGLAQDVLIHLGLYKGERDSKFGPIQEEATEDFQKRAGIEVDGINGPDTWYSMATNPNHPIQEGLGKKAKNGNPRAKVAQRVIGLKGDQVNGKLGTRWTTRAKQVQRWLGITDDAKWGRNTRSALVKKG